MVGLLHDRDGLSQRAGQGPAETFGICSEERASALAVGGVVIVNFKIDSLSSALH